MLTESETTLAISDLSLQSFKRLLDAWIRTEIGQHALANLAAVANLTGACRLTVLGDNVPVTTLNWHTCRAVREASLAATGSTAAPPRAQ